MRNYQDVVTLEVSSLKITSGPRHCHCLAENRLVISTVKFVKKITRKEETLNIKRKCILSVFKYLKSFNSFQKSCIKGCLGLVRTK